MKDDTSTLSAGLSTASVMTQLNPGDHAALFFRTRNEQLQAVIPYIKTGLSRNERCLYIAKDTSPGFVLDALQAAGVDTAAAVRAGQLTVASPDSTYLQYGVFDPEKTVDGLKREVQTALDDGYSGFRGTGELGWAAAMPSALLRLYDYELLLHQTFSPHFTALCQYDETLFGPQLVAKMLRIHLKVVARGRLFDNPFYLGPGHDLTKHPLATVADLVQTQTDVVGSR